MLQIQQGQKYWSNIFHFEWTFEKCFILILRLKYGDHAIFGGRSFKMSYIFFIFIYRDYIMINRYSMIVTNTARSKILIKHIPFWMNNWKLFHLNPKTEIWRSCNFWGGGAFIQNELYFNIFIYRDYIMISSDSMMVTNTTRSKILIKHIPFWINNWKMLHFHPKTEIWVSCNFGGRSLKMSYILTFLYTAIT